MLVLLLSFSRSLAMKCASMPGFIKQMYIVLVLLSFARLLAMKCASMPGFIKQMFIVLVLMLFLGRLLAMKCASMTGVTVKMHSSKIVLPSNYLPGNKNSPVFFSQEIITPRSIYLLVKYHCLQEIWTPL